LPSAPLATPYDARSLARPGFEHDKHFVPLPLPQPQSDLAAVRA
jgi:hypothetical protein